MTDQLALFEEMSGSERDAIVADFLARHTTTEGPAKKAAVHRPRPCICQHPLVFAYELGEGRCELCGREPR